MWLLLTDGGSVWSSDDDQTVIDRIRSFGDRGGNVSATRVAELLSERRAYTPDLGDMVVGHCPTVRLRHMA